MTPSGNGATASSPAPSPAAFPSVLLCVTGSIAAYKAVELARLFVGQGSRVRVAMTRAATKFVGPITFEAVTGNPVFTDVFASASGPVDRYGPGSGESSSGSIEHIEVSKQPDLILVAPASADVIGRVAHGLADDVVTTSILAADAPVVFAPAMNQRMWKNAIVQANVKTLTDAGYRFLGPVTGSLACGEEGIGRMMEPEKIVASLGRALGGGPSVDLRGKRVLVGLGRTEEMLDPVRFISNRSSGKMGVAIVEAALEAGADVACVAGPTAVPIPSDATVTHVTTAEQMREAIQARFDDCDALVMVAAVADYRAATEKLHKMESGQHRPSIELEANDDILASLKSRRKKQIVVGFALETQSEEQRARRKLADKGLDMIVVNNPLKEGAEFGGDTNLVSFLYRSGKSVQLPMMEKRALGAEIVQQLEYLLAHPDGKQPPRPGTGARAAAGSPATPAASGQTASGEARDGGSRGRSRGGRRRPPRKKSVSSASTGS